MQRGVRRNDIFQYTEDYQVFLILVKKAMERYECKIHAYCLMTNHYHMLIQMSAEPLWKFVKVVAQQYAVYYNQKNGYCGHLFEGRYKCCLVKDDAYFLQSSRYIHRNPVKAGIVCVPHEYNWSSYRTMIGMEDDRITQRETTLSYFYGNDAKRYQDFVENYKTRYIVEPACSRQIREEENLWLPW